jgi:hypothetical protein
MGHSWLISLMEFAWSIRKYELFAIGSGFG